MNNIKNCSNPLQTRVRAGIYMPGKLILPAAMFFIGVCLLPSCGPSREEMAYREQSKLISDSVSSYLPGISADTINGIAHNFIRTADIKCKVNNVLKASNAIEDLLIKKGAYISSSHLSSQINHTNKVLFKKDSVIESTFYTTVNLIQMRIPAAQLDSMIREISDLALFIDFRKVNANDVKMDLFANALREKSLRNYQLAVKNKVQSAPDKMPEQIKAQEAILEKQNQADLTRINSYDLADRVNYSTLTLELYQSETINTEVLFNSPPVKPYSPSFAAELKSSFLNGLQILKNFILFLINIWGIVLTACVLYFLIRKFRFYFINKIPVK